MNFRDLVHFFIYQSTRYLSPMPVAVEWVFVLLAGVIVAYAPCGWLDRVRHIFRRLAQRRMLCIAICGLLPILLRVSLLGIVPVPDPSIHDEFSHLLLGDTLAHGRLANPVHPLWQHFESIHIIQKPSYASMYLPGQGVFLALGQILFREPWAGVVISVGLMFAALCWLMQGWLPPAWAFYGTLIAIFKVGVTGPWINSYLGGAVSAIAGALLIGCLGRFRQSGLRPIHGVLFGFGLVVLINSRPFEGAVLSFAIVAYFGYKLISRPLTDRAAFLRGFALAAVLVLSCGAAFTSFYCYRVTGNPLRLPYLVNRDTYGWPENLAILPAKQLVLRHKVMQDLYLREVHHHDAYASWDRLIDNLNNRVFDNWAFFIGPALTIPFVFLPRVYWDRRTRPLVVLLAIMLLLNLSQLLLYPYHFAPLVPMLFTILTQGIRHVYVRLSQLGRLRAIHFAIVLPVVLMIVSAMKQSAAELQIPLSYWESATEGHRDARASIQQWLNSRPGKQLVIVRYAPNHNSDQEWVYNSADIDGSKVVWAREMTPDADRKLVRYFADRRAWLLQPDVWPTRVVPYYDTTLPQCPNEK